jgi:peptide/nickel transport system substrate-binding protein
MRQLLRFLMVVALAFVASRCGPPAAFSTPSRTGEFRVLIPARPASLNPNLALDEFASVVGRSIFSHLVTLNESGRVLPELAQSWSVSPDGRVYTFALRPDVKWHDGAALTAADVQWTFETVAKDGVGRDAFGAVERIEAPDPLQVRVTLRYPWAPFISEVALFGTAILPRHVYAGTDWRTNPANERPIGTGPFRFAGWRDADTLVLEANTSYFRPGPFVERVVFLVTPPEVAARKLLEGEADFSVTRPPHLKVSGLIPSSLVVKPLPTSARYYLAMNLRREPFKDVRVRRALASAIDRRKIVKEALEGFGAPAVGWYTPDVDWAYNPDARVPEYDAAAASRLLDAADLRRGARGERVRVSMVMPNATVLGELGRVVATQLAGVGIGVDVLALPTSEWAKRVVAEHDFDLAIIGGAQGPDPDALRQRFSSRTATGAYIGYASAEFEDAVERGARTLDLAQRAAAYYEAQEILARDVPVVPLVESVKVIIHNARVSGLPQLEARALVGWFDFSLVRVTPPAAEATP